ncbi:MAG: electron transfer flavoprotein subunit alpha/FixB family protein [Desulfobacterales bacterium]|nr:electron transfer flavoprotein subunit alpha/FixB family protein [Desulfobacterales bacterium]
MKRICIFQDTDRPGSTPDLLGAAERLHGDGAFESHLVLLNGSADDFFGLFHHVHRVADGLVAAYDPRGITEVLENLHQNLRFHNILIPATGLGKMIAPRLAQRLETGLVSGVTDIKHSSDGIELIRPAYSGKILEGIQVSGSGPVVMSIRPNAFDHKPKGSLQTLISEYATPVTTRSGITRVHVEERSERPDHKAKDIRDSHVLIAGGGGVKEHFSALVELADALGGAVAASRKLVDQGIAQRRIQVGQSGKTVSPQLYMALGIHGSVQHMAGLRQVDTLISVNRSDLAPICTLSDMVVQGDAGEFIPKLMEKISTYRSGNKGS